MDFSSIPRAVESIQRRQPPLPQSVLDACQALSLLQEPNDCRAPSLLSVLQSFFVEEARWEALAVGLYVSTEILRAPNDKDKEEDRKSMNSTLPWLDGPTLRSQLLPSDVTEIYQMLHTACLRHLEHPEPRIRTLIIQAVSVYMRLKPEEQGDLDLVECRAQELQNLLWNRIKVNDDEEPDIEEENPTVVPSQSTPFLETQWLCLASLMGALSHRYVELFPTMTIPFVHTVEALVVRNSSSHTSSHVRVAALQTMEQWIRALTAGSDPTETLLLADPESSVRSTTVAIIVSGLADPSSQLRLAASVLCRTWFESLEYSKGSEKPNNMMSILLPPMCFNRFDAALGVKLYSQETWKLMFPANVAEEDDAPSAGLLAVIQYLPFVCQYYVQNCRTEHPPTIRSSAGAAMAELVDRLGHHPDYRARLKPYLRSFWQALLTNVQDAAWPVREAAGVALGALCKAFPEVAEEEWPTLWDLWTEQLTDPVGSEAAAVGLADLWEAFGHEDGRIRAVIDQQLPRRNGGTVGSPQTDHACGVLKSTNDGHHGCPHCGRRASDGCIYLIREYVVRGTLEGSVKTLSDRELMPLLEGLVNACRGSVELRTTLWKCLPTMAYALGKVRYKRLYLDIFTDLLCSDLESHSASHRSHAAIQCAEELGALVGPTIFRGRLDDYQRECFDRVMREREGMPNGPLLVDDVFAHLDSPPWSNGAP